MRKDENKPKKITSRKNKDNTPQKKKVTVRRSFYTFAEDYPGGGSSLEYRKTIESEKKDRKIAKGIFAALGIIIVFLASFFATRTVLEIANEPTTQETVSEKKEPETTEVSTTEPATEPVTEPSTRETTLTTEPTTQKQTNAYGYEVTLEEPERENNVTSIGSDG